MRAANKVSFVDCSDRAGVLTSAAAGTFFVIDNRKIIYYLYCALGAYLLALSAGYTALIAEFAYGSAFIVVITLNDNSYRVVYKMYNSVRTSLYAKSAAYTFSRVNVSNTLFVNTNSIARANRNAVAVAKAGKGAESVA